VLVTLNCHPNAELQIDLHVEKDTGDRLSPGMFGHMRFPDLREVRSRCRSSMETSPVEKYRPRPVFCRVSIEAAAADH